MRKIIETIVFVTKFYKLNPKSRKLIMQTIILEEKVSTYEKKTNRQYSIPRR